MRKPSELPFPFSAGPFAVSAARDAGITPGRLRSGDLTAPYRGVRTPRTVSSLEDRMSALQQAIPSHVFFSHQTAGALYLLPLPRRVERETGLHVSVLAPLYPPRIRGATGHRLLAADIRTYRGYRVISPVQAWMQLGGILGDDDLVVAGDALVRRKYPLATLDAIAAAMTSADRARNVKALRRALPRLRAGTDSPMETKLRLLIVGSGLPEPIVGHRIIDSDGYFVAAPDLAYVEWKIAIEYEGEVHQSNPRVFADDIDRRERMEAAGWLVIRVISRHLVSRPDLLIARLARALQERAPF